MKISYVIPCYNSSKALKKVVFQITEKMRLMSNYEYEIILVDDFSRDDTMTVIQNLCKECDSIKGLGFSRNFGQHAALMAGFRQVTGDIIVCLDDDGQTPAEEADKLIDKIIEGYDVVYAKYENKMHSLFRNTSSYINMRMTEKLLGKPEELYISSYFAVRRYVIDEIKKYENPYPYVIGLILRSTENICNVVVTHRARQEGRSGYSLKKLIALWVNGFTTFSVKPLRFAVLCGALLSFMGFLCIVWTIINKFLNPFVPIGWSSTIAVILIVGGGILLELGVIGEYIGRIYMCINRSPQYVLKENINTKEGMSAKQGKDSETFRSPR